MTAGLWPSGIKAPMFWVTNQTFGMGGWARVGVIWNDNVPNNKGCFLISKRDLEAAQSQSRGKSLGSRFLGLHTCYCMPGPPVRHLPGHRSFVPVAVHANNVCLRVFTQFGKILSPEGFEFPFVLWNGLHWEPAEVTLTAPFADTADSGRVLEPMCSVFEKGQLVLLFSEDSHCHFKELCWHTPEEIPT